MSIHMTNDFRTAFLQPNENLKGFIKKINVFYWFPLLWKFKNQRCSPSTGKENQKP
jgi:hypothetical protein